MAKKPLPCPTIVRQLVRYEPHTGRLFWRQRPLWVFKSAGSARRWNSRYAGKPALAYIDNHGYEMGALLSQRHMKAHRAAWAIYYGRWPDGHIDHINGDRSDNRIRNLRDVSRLENQRNVALNRRNKSGYLGVYWLDSCRRWWAYIGSGPTRKTLGYFECKADAIAARKSAERDIGYHKNHGRKSGCGHGDDRVRGSVKEGR